MSKKTINFSVDEINNLLTLTDNSSFVSVEKYGIKPGYDVDVEDNTTKFQQMINDCKNKKVIVFPAGDFVFNSIDLGEKNNITIKGVSSNFASFAQKDINTGEITDTFTRIICNEENGKTFFNHKNCVLVLDHIAFYNLAKDENGNFIDNQEAKDCIFMKHTRSEGANKNVEKGKVFATDCAFYGWKVVFGCKFTMQHLEDEWGTGLQESTYQSENDNGEDGVGYYKQSCVVANRCRFTRNGVGVNQTVDGRLIDCSFNKNDYAIVFRENSGFSTILGCRIEWNNYNGIYSDKAHEVNVSNCEFDCNGHAGLYATNNTNSIFKNSSYRRNGAKIETQEDESHKKDFERNVHIYAKGNIDCNFTGNTTVAKPISDVGSAAERPSNCSCFIENDNCVISLNNLRGCTCSNKVEANYVRYNINCVITDNNPKLAQESFAPDNGTVIKNNQIAVSQICQVALSYYKARYKEDGTPFFIYDTAHTPTSDQYDPTSEEWSGAIDCSTFIGLVLRGIPFEKSPYTTVLGSTINIDSDSVEEDNYYDNTFETDAETGGYTNSSLIANDLEYPWALNLFEWKYPVEIGGDPAQVRRASQIAEWMQAMGWEIPLDEQFTNVEPGDIIFWAKKKSDGTFIREKRFMHISHVAMCYNKVKAPDDYPEGYPIKHTMMEVTTVSPYVLNRSLEKCSPGSVVMVCRPNLGSFDPKTRIGNITNLYNITDIDEYFYEGTVYLTSKITDGLPEAFSNGSHLMLDVTITRTRVGKIYSITQKLWDAKNPDRIYIRSQYNYEEPVSSDIWTDWFVFLNSKDVVTREEYENLLERISNLENK